MKDLGYAYLHYDLLDRATLIIITLKVQLPYIEMHEQHLQKCMFVKVNFFDIESKSKIGFEKNDMHVIIIIESTTIMLSIPAFQPKLIPMFFRMDSIKKLKNSIQSWRCATIVVIIISLKGAGDNKGEK
jgi:hypothetical protein